MITDKQLIEFAKFKTNYRTPEIQKHFNVSYDEAVKIKRRIVKIVNG